MVEFGRVGNAKSFEDVSDDELDASRVRLLRGASSPDTSSSPKCAPPLAGIGKALNGNVSSVGDVDPVNSVSRVRVAGAGGRWYSRSSAGPPCEGVPARGEATMLETGEAKSIHCREEGGDRLRLRAVGTVFSPVSTTGGTFSPADRREFSPSTGAPKLNQHRRCQLLNACQLTGGVSVARI